MEHELRVLAARLDRLEQLLRLSPIPICWGGPEFAMPLMNHRDRIEDQRGHVVGTVDVVNIANGYWAMLRERGLL